jgi:hypothetical protein
MSIRILKNPHTPHELIDDLEATFWTMLYAALHRFLHKEKVAMSMFSQAHLGENGVVTGGKFKMAALVEMADLLTFKCLPLKTLFVSLSKALLAYYTALSLLTAAKDDAELDGKVDSDDFDPVAEAQDIVDQHYRKLSKPSFWRAELKRALNRPGWCDDAIDEDWYAQQTQEEATQKFEFVTRTTYAVGKQPALNEENDLETENVDTLGNDDESSCEEVEDDETGNITDDSDHLDGVAPVSPSQQSIGTLNLGPSPLASPSEAQFLLHPSLSPLSPISSTSETESLPVTAKRSHFEVAGPSNAGPSRQTKRFKTSRDWPSSPTPDFPRRSGIQRAVTGEPSVIRSGPSRYEHWMVTRARAKGASGKFKSAD